MKLRNVLMIAGALLVSAPAFAGFDSDFANLEAQLKALEQKENARFAQEEQIAKQAKKNLENLKLMKAKAVERERILVSMNGKNIYPAEAARILKGYQSFKGDIDKQIKVEERVIFEFNQLKTLR